MTSLLHPIFGIGKKMFSGYDIPPQEVAELYKLYTQTGGPSWTNHTNWFENKQCSTWFGLTVAGGRVTKIGLYYNNLVGRITSLNLLAFSQLQELYVQGNTVVDPKQFLTGDVTNWGLPSTLTVLQLHTNADISGMVSLDSLPSPAMYYYLRDCPTLRCSGGSTVMKCNGVASLRLEKMGSTALDKDSIIERIYADRALFTNAAHALNISGGPALTGAYQTSAAPSTPAEKAYALVNDPNSEGFLKWVITL